MLYNNATDYGLAGKLQIGSHQVLRNPRIKLCCQLRRHFRVASDFASSNESLNSWVLWVDQSIDRNVLLDVIELQMFQKSWQVFVRQWLSQELREFFQ